MRDHTPSRVLAVAIVAMLVSALAARAADPAVEAPAVVTQSFAGGYVGSPACAECHRTAFDTWAGSQHARAMQVADAKSVLGDFRNARFTYAGTTSTFFTRDGKYFVRTDGPDGKLADFQILYTFGVAPLQQYLIELPGGRLQALGIAWDSRPKSAGGRRWFHLYPGEKIRAGDPLHWTGVGQNWNFMCAECHSTDLRKRFDAATGRFRTTWSEISVGCEACHGPGADHIAWAREKAAGKATKVPDLGLAIVLDERKGVRWIPTATGNAERSTPRTSSREVEVCARCHARAARLSDDYVHGRPPLDTHRLARLDEGLYWHDGQMRDEVYNWGSFVQSRMYAQGVTCSDCHGPHTQALRAPGNAMCATCHAPTRFDTAAHTHHAQGSAGAACTACHMPTTIYMQVDPRHDHSMRIPRPELSAKLGMPNACNGCHAKKSPQWAADAIAKWTGKTPVGHQNFAEALHAGSVGAPGARDALQAIADDPAQPAIVRASAIDRLGPWLTPETLSSVTNALNDPDPLMRLAAVEALSATDPATRLRYLPRLLADPVRSVRIEAARALTGPEESRIPAPQRDAFAKALAEYVAVQTYNADRPEGHVNLGNLYALRGDPDRARAQFEQALAIDPRAVEARVNLADLHRAWGADGEAEAVLRKGIALEPRAAPLHHALGLALVRQKQTAAAVRELGEAAKLAPANARYAYVYAVALHDTGRPQDALRVLREALKRQPYDREVLFALAQYSAAGNRESALGYARQLLELDPENPQYARLVASLSGGTGR